MEAYQANVGGDGLGVDAAHITMQTCARDADVVVAAEEPVPGRCFEVSSEDDDAGLAQTVGLVEVAEPLALQVLPFAVRELSFFRCFFFVSTSTNFRLA